LHGGSYNFMTLSKIVLYAFQRDNIQTLAFLYTDPGSGALLWQLLIASFFGALFYARSFIRRVQATISRKRRNNQSEQGAPDDKATSTTPNEDKLP
jgi:hypothetical protein